MAARILELRQAKNWSQSELAAKAGVSYAQIGRYETKGSQPPAEVLKKLAEALDNTVDFLINGNTEDKAKASLMDAEVIRYFKEVDTCRLKINPPSCELSVVFSVM